MYCIIKKWIWPEKREDSKVNWAWKGHWVWPNKKTRLEAVVGQRRKLKKLGIIGELPVIRKQGWGLYLPAKPPRPTRSKVATLFYSSMASISAVGLLPSLTLSVTKASTMVRRCPAIHISVAFHYLLIDLPCVVSVMLQTNYSCIT